MSKTIAVIGAGTMGHGIAELAALSGYSVNLYDIDDEAVRKGFDQICWSLEKLVEKGMINADMSKADEIGLDTIVNHLEKTLEKHQNDRYKPTQLLLDKAQRGELGEKSGVGFYRYDG